MIIERDIYSKIKPVINSPEAVIVTGMRRTGKTTLLKYIFERIDSNSKIFLDLENPINQKYFEETDYEKIIDSLKLLGMKTGQRSFVFLDEIQFAKNISSVVKYLIDHHQIKFFLSGSASFYLKNLFSESLSGRKYIFELFPFSFGEFLKLKKAEISIPGSGEKINQPIFEKINRYFEEYILFGGFPGVAQKSSAEEKRMALEDIFSSYFQLEVQQLSDFKKTNVIRDLMLLLLERAGSKLDILKLSKELSVSRQTLSEYVSFLESTYFVKLVRPFSRKRDVEIRNVPKVYACDSGLVSRFSKVSEGSLFENSIFQILRLKGEVNYYQRKSGAEIDFILDKKFAYEVKNFPSKGDIAKIKRLSDSLKIEDYKIISRRYSDLEKVTYGFLI